MSLGFPCCSLSTTAYNCRSDSTSPQTPQVPGHLIPESATHIQLTLVRQLLTHMLFPHVYLSVHFSDDWLFGSFFLQVVGPPWTTFLGFCHSRLAVLTSTRASIVAITTCSQLTATHKKLQLPSTRLCIICVLCLTVMKQQSASHFIAIINRLLRFPWIKSSVRTIMLMWKDRLYLITTSWFMPYSISECLGQD